MNIEKDGSKESIDWANMKVTDEGNEYRKECLMNSLQTWE